MKTILSLRNTSSPPPGAVVSILRKSRTCPRNFSPSSIRKLSPHRWSHSVTIRRAGSMTDFLPIRNSSPAFAIPMASSPSNSCASTMIAATNSGTSPAKPSTPFPRPTIRYSFLRLKKKLRLTSRGRMAERSIVSLARRVLEVAIFILVALIVLSGLGVNVTAALAGLGIGGLAIGLGAQKTFENLLGGISILTDKALVIGDPCRIGDQRGVVEDIGLRSTKLRTEDRTVVTIPNGTVATAVLENYRQRDKILFRQLLRLRYDLSSDHLRYVLEEARAVLKQNDHVENASSRVRLLRMAEYSIEVEIYAYILVRDYAEFLALQEELILSIVDAIEKTGAAIALPSVGPVLTQDAWIDPEKAKSANERFEKSRDSRASDSNSPPK